ncbi:ATP-binding protein [Micromonospora sp. NPDC048930]|uniref:ATP-binding protein n=1 Tax=Micromonospora sp. NPDC048930 TaxID=3364261 RepID=UPI003724A6E8
MALLRACEVPDERALIWLEAWARLSAARAMNSTAAGGGRLRLVRGAGETGGEVAGFGRVSTLGARSGGERLVPRRLPRPSVDLPPVANGRSPISAPVPFQLPPAPPTVVGRATEIRQLIGATAVDGAVCAIEGAGGVGKSALALHLAHQIAAEYEGGCLYADLHGASAGIAPAEPADVLARFLRALGAPAVPASVEEATALLRTWTAERGVLVVLDNAASAAQVRPLLLSGPGCTTLITSRWALADLDATLRIRLGPLPDDAALALLSGLSGGRRVTAEPAAAALVVRRCGGLPLALRIVGARAAAVADASLAGLAERMNDERRRLDVLEIGDLSVRASLHVGYQAFGAAPQGDRRQAARLFRLAALPDWADTTAYACAVLAEIPVVAAERALDSLVGAHLLEPSGDGRYRFHDIVRLYARECADAAEDTSDREAALGRLTTWLVATTGTAALLLYPQERFPIPIPRYPPGFAGPPLAGAADAWAWFEREHTNLVMIARQQVAAGRTLPEVRDLALVAAKFYDYSGYSAEQQQLGQLAVEAAQRLGDRSGAALALNIVAVSLLRQGRRNEAIPLLERNLAVQRELGDRAREAACLNNLGNALRDEGDLEAAVGHLQAALVIRRELGDRGKESSVLDNLALVFQRQGEYRQAIAHHEAGLAITVEGTDPMREAQALVNFAETLQVSGDHHAAIARASESLEICRRYEHQRGIGLALQVLGDAHAGLGRRSEAYRHWREALVRLDGLDREACARLRAALGGDEPAG